MRASQADSVENIGGDGKGQKKMGEKGQIPACVCECVPRAERWKLMGENKERDGGKIASYVKECSRLGGCDTNWGAGSVGLRGILVFLLSRIEGVFASSWQVSGMFVLLSNPLV